MATDEVERLPEALRAVGLAVIAAQDDDALIVGLVGHDRREVAVVRAGEVGDWFTIAAPDEALSAGHLGSMWSAVRHGDITVEVLPHDGGWRAASPEDIVLLDVAQNVMVWSLRDGDREIAGSTRPVPVSEPRSRSDLLIAMDADEGFDSTQRPAVPSVEQREAIRSLLAGITPVRSLALRLHTFSAVDRLTITPVHAYRETVRNGRSECEEAEWKAADGVPDWVPSTSPPAIGAVSLAVGGNELMLFGVGPLAVVGWLGQAGDATFIGANDLPGGEDVLRLGRALFGSDVAAYASAWLPPTGIVRPIIVNGTHTRQSRTARPLTRSAPIDLQATSDAAAALGQRETVVLLPLTSKQLSGDQRSWIVSRVFSEVRPTPRVVEIGFAVADYWATSGGEVRLDYVVSPDDPVGRIEADGTMTDQCFVDRSGHLVIEPATCPYCNTLTCVRCELSVQPCSICGIWTCGRCSPTFPGVGARCPACRSLRRLGWSERRRHPVLRSSGRVVAYGVDPVHHVYLVGDGGSVNLITLGLTFDARAATTRFPIGSPQSAELARLAGK